MAVKETGRKEKLKKMLKTEKNTCSTGLADAETLIPKTEDTTQQGTRACARGASVPAELGCRASPYFFSYTA